MVGPSDSFTHASQKFSEASREAIAGLQNMPVPPPAYTANAVAEIEDSDSKNDDADSWKGPPAIVHIDASISIEGTGNQIALPPHLSSRALTVVGDSVRIAQGSPMDYLGYPSVMDPNRLADDRAKQITDAVMQDLKDSGIFAATITPMRQLDVHVDASISVKGDRNIVAPNVSGTRAGEMPSPLRDSRGGDALEGSGSGSGDQRGRQPMEAVVEGETQDQAQAPMLVDTTTQEDSGLGAGSGEEPVTPNTKRKRASGRDGGDDGEGWQKRAKI